MLRSTRGAIRRLFCCVGFALLSLVLAGNAAQAQMTKWKTVEVMLSPNGGVSPDDVVNFFKNKGGQRSPPITALSVESPQIALYLLPIRASGDFLTYLNNNPTLERAELERYVIVVYPPNANTQTAVTALQADAAVSWAAETPSGALSSASLIHFEVPQDVGLLTPMAGAQYGRDSFNIDAAWQLSQGYALIGAIDNGLAVNHALLRQFSNTGTYLGGNFVSASSLDLSLSGVGAVQNDIAPITQPDVDEMRPVPSLGPNNWCLGPVGPPPATLAPTIAGHGTHVSGLIAANGADASHPRGTCKNCGIAMYKVNYWYCDYPGVMKADIDYAAATAAITYLSDSGAQVINMSMHFPSITDQNYCTNNPGTAICKALMHANYRGVAVAASSGNDRKPLDFPASDARVIAAGGYDSSLSLWDESPGNFTNCPVGYPALGDQCGSNYTASTGAKQELVASAKDVVSLTYPNQNWNAGAHCGDGFPGPMGSGEGLCTGTSMSSPQIAGVVGLLRSINPLVLPSKPIPNVAVGEPTGIRTVLKRTTFQNQASPGYWNAQYGYGRPDAAAAAKAMLGKVAGQQVVNRVTPLFRFYSAAANDYADATSPQLAMAYIISQALAYTPVGQAIPGYASFPPPPPGTSALPAPKANVYVMTTANVPRPGYPPLVALYLMDRARAFPAGCTPGAPGCNGNNRDLMLVTTVSNIEQAHAQGYDLRTIQGYVYAPCTPEPTCIPPRAEKFYRKCKTSIDDCATFLESERTTFEGQGYTAAYPSGSNTLLGYAYPATDTDGDGLVDGMEYVIGSNPNSPPGALDASNYPLAGVPVADPCQGAAAAGCLADMIFKNGFQ